MRNNYVNTDSTKGPSQPCNSSVNKSAFHNTQQSKSNATNKLYLDTNTKLNIQKPNQISFQNSIEQLSQPQSIYENYNFNPAIVSGDSTLPQRKSRLFNRSLETSEKSPKTEIKRDLSMPPISAKQLSLADNNIYSHYSTEQNHKKYSIDADLNLEGNNFDDSSSFMYDSIITNVSITPPPVHIVSTASTSDYINRKAIIRPLAFRPIQTEWIPANADHSPTKPPVALKTKIPQGKRSSPPPVPPHASRLSTKPNLSRVQSAKSGDSSGYYSSRATGTLTGTISSTDISPTFDESISIMDNFQTADVYYNAGELTSAIDNLGREPEHDDENFKSSLDSEIMSERQRGKILEASLTNSNCKLLDAESHIIELKKRLTQRSIELNKAMESLESVKRNLEHQNQKSLHLEKTIQSLKMISNDHNRGCEVRNQSTQTPKSSNDIATNKLLEQFDDERKTWLAEKCKVLTYQRQIESNFQQLLIKCRRLESHVIQMKTQLKDCRVKPSHTANHIEDHDKSSSNSAESSHRPYFTNISRIEVTEHQSSF